MQPKIKTFQLLTLASAVTATSMALAQSSDDAEPTMSMIEEVVVIGNREKRLIDASVPYTTIGEDELLQQAPRSVADALINIPSLQTNNALGNTNNDFRFRGIGAGGTQFLEFEEDGIPITRDAPDFLYRVTNTATAGITAVRGGNSPILRTAAIGAVVNFKYKEGSRDEHEGDVFLQTSDFGMRRMEAWIGGPLNDQLTYSLAGYYTTDDGIREVDFPGNEGYNLYGNLKYHFADDSGYLKVSARTFNESNVVYLGTPLTGDLKNPQRFPGGPDITTGSILSRDIALATTFSAPNDPSLLDLTNGNESDMTYVGSELKKEWVLDNGGTVEFVSRNRYTDVRSGFSGYYSAGFWLNGDFQTGESLIPNMMSPSFPIGQLSSFASALPSGFAPTGYTIATQNGEVLDQGTITDANGNGFIDAGEAASTSATLANGNGIFMPIAAFDQDNPQTAFQQDLELNFSFDTDNASHFASIGYYYLNSERSQDNRQQFTLTDLRQQARRVNVSLQDATGASVMLNDDGFLTHNHWLNRDRIDDEINAYYANYEFQTGNLTLDVGARHDEFSATRLFNPSVDYFGTGPNQVPVPPPGTSVSAPSLTIARVDGAFLTDFDFTTRELSYTAGVNYLVTDTFGVYGRYTQGYLPAINGATGTEVIELGARYQGGDFAIAVNFFDMLQEGDVQDRGVNIDGEDVVVRLQTDRQSQGIEIEGFYDLFDNFRITLSGTYMQPEFASGGSATLRPGSGIGDDALQDIIEELTAIDGNQIANQPELLFTAGLQYTLYVGDFGQLIFSGLARHVGEVPINDQNTRYFESYTKYDAGVIFESASGDWYARLNVQNLTDEDAIVRLEGGSVNTSITGGDIGADGFIGRSVQGRNIVFGAGYRF